MIFFLSERKIESNVSDINTGGVLSVCNFVVKCFRERKEKRKKKQRTEPVSFLTGVNIYKIIHFCIFTALQADMLMLFSKDMLSIP